MNNEQAMASLARSDLREANNAAQLLRDEKTHFERESETLAVPTALIETYETRLEHLAKFNTHHAQRLRRATEEFCTGLQALDDEQGIAYGRLDDPLLGSYIIWYNPEGAVVVGCLYVIGKSEVTEDVWQSLWQED